MSTPINDGGPAFPCQPKDAQGYPMGPLECGMSLRDWFAGQALVGIWASPEASGDAANLARLAYISADAMLAARAANTHDQ